MEQKEKRGMITSVREYIRNIAPTLSAYLAIRQEANQKGTSSMTMREINREIADHRQAKKKK